MGDFNGHTGLRGKQKLDENGKMILEWMDKYRMILLNEDPKCEGTYTWGRQEQKSVIDYALVTEKGYSKFHNMVIDEKKEILYMICQITIS